MPIASPELSLRRRLFGVLEEDNLLSKKISPAGRHSFKWAASVHSLREDEQFV